VVYVIDDNESVLPDIKVGRYYQLENQVSALANFELVANIPLMK
jgi:hypothetical protein